jgi:hypothetical protein
VQTQQEVIAWVDAVVTRADGTVENLGRIYERDTDPAPDQQEEE